MSIADPGVLKAYATRDATNREYAGEIQPPTVTPSSPTRQPRKI